MLKKILNKKGLLSLTFLLISFAVYSQTIKGVIKDQDGGVLPGVSIRIKEAPGVAVVSRSDGSFSIPLSPGYKTLVFTYIGFNRKEVPIGNSVSFNITLQQSQTSLNEVVITTGYSTTTRKDLTGSIGVADVESMQKAPVLSFENALEGRVAGLQISSNDGQPGSDNTILIRGVGSITQSSAPLWVIDGVAMENPDNNLIDPSNVESITVLKDASSTAIYGARGSNGVIVVTTKRGQSGPSRINYSGNYGLNVPYKYMQLLNPYQFVKLNTDVANYFGIIGGNPYLANGKVLEDYRDTKAYDWQGQLLRNAGQLTNSVSVSGGNNGTVYSLAVNSITQQGIILNSSYTRYGGKFTIDQKIGAHAKIGGSLSYTIGNQVGSSTTGGTSNALFYSVFAYQPLPTALTSLDQFATELYDPDNPTSGDYRINPILNQSNQFNHYISNYITGNIYVNYNILKNLVLKVQGSLNTNMVRHEVFNNDQTYAGGPRSTNGVNGSINNARTDIYNNTDLLQYTNTFNHDHHLDVLLGVSAEEAKSSSYGFSSTQIPVASLGISGLDAGTVGTSPTASISYNTLLSAFGSINYNYKERYYLTGTFRADGSSKFPQDQWGYFPSGGIKWKFTEESFMKKQSILSDGNIRFTYGVSGNNRVGDFDTYPTIKFQSQLYLNGINQGNSAALTALGNSSLKWESTTEKDLGFDLGFFKNRLNLTVDLYNRETSNLLFAANIPNSSGFSTILENVAGITNRGLEITVGGNIIQKKNFTYSANLNISFNRNRLDKLADPAADGYASIVNWDALLNTTPAYIAKVGQPLGQIYGYIYQGLYQYSDFDRQPNGTYVLKPNLPSNSTTAARSSVTPGSPKFADLNGDGQIDLNDRTIIGHGYPLHTGGFNNNFRYKNFDLNIFLQWSYGNDIINANRMYFGYGLGITNRSTSNPFQNAFAEYANHWTPTNQNTDIPTVGKTASVYSTQSVEDGSYLRLKTLNIGYTFPQSVLSRIGIKKLRVYLAANNLVTITGYKGYDPELSAYSSNLTPGLDWSTYPRPITITAGLNLTL